MTEDTAIDTSRPHVSALLWADILGKPFQDHENPISTEVKTRGRPRKVVNKVGAKRTHKMSDDEPEFRNLLPSSIHKIVLDYKEYIQEGSSPKIALENICKLYRIPYAQAFNICADEY
jgi:hypothetical protein